MKTKVACYLRVSTSEQKTDSQKPSIKNWLDNQHIKSDRVKWYEDKASGSSTAARVQLQDMLHDIEHGKIDTVVCYRLDRLSRSCRQGLGLLADLAEKGIRVVSTSQGIEFNGSMGKFLSALFLAIAELERETIVSRIQDGLAAAKERGQVLGRPRNDKKLAKIDKLYNSGKSVVELSKQFKCSRQNIYLALKRGEKVSSK